MAGKSYYERTVALFKEKDFMVGKVESYNAFTNQRKDLFGFIDAVARHPNYGNVDIQSCGSDFSEHVKKLTGDKREAVIISLLAGNRIFLIGWRKLKGKMQPRIKEFLLSDFPEITTSVLVEIKGISEADADQILSDTHPAIFT